MNWKIFPIFLAFLCMGFADAVGPFVGVAKESFVLSNTVAQLLPFMGFIMFGVLSIPVGVLQDKVGKKKILMLGLFVAVLGLAFPTFFGMNSYPVFLSTVMFMGADLILPGLEHFGIDTTAGEKWLNTRAASR